MQCPNCSGSDIDLSFAPPRCRTCDPVDETRTDRIIQRWLLEDSMRGLEIRKRATGILRITAKQAGRPIVAQEEGRSLLTLLDRIADQLKV